MSINSNNIDKWLFDYYEGNLSPSDIRKLEQFLQKNPDYYEDAEAWKDSFVEESMPAFDTTALLKDIQPANRKKLSYAALLLLLIGASASVYYLSPSNNTSSTIAKKAVKTMPYVNDQRMSDYRALSQLTDENAVVTENNNGSAAGNTTNLVNNQPAANNGLTASRANVVAAGNHPINFQPTGNQNTVIALNAANVPNANPNNPVNNSPLLAVQPVNAENNQANSTHNGSATNVAIHPNGVSPSNIDLIHEITGQAINEIQETLYNNEAGQSLTEEINLTLGEPVAENKNNPENVNNKDLKEKTNSVENKTSGLGPDEILANAKKEDTKKPIESEDIKKSRTQSDNGLKFTNLRQVTLLNTLTEFDNNASFISQQYGVDGYVGLRFTQTGNKEQGVGQLAGVSQYFRKLKTTVNFALHNDKDGLIKNVGGVLQVATQFKIDRYQSIIPSLSVNMDQYSFDNSGYFYTNLNPDPNIVSYAADMLTGNEDYHPYVNTTKMNVGAGMLYHHKKFFVSLAANGLLQPKFTYENINGSGKYKNPTTVNMVAGTDFVSKNRPELSLSPQFSINVRGLEANFAAGAVVKYNTWGAGAGISSTGAVNVYGGYTHRTFSLQYRFMYDKMDSPFKYINGHYITTHFNLKSLVKKQKPILDSEK